jgi:hypothetical protein
VVLDTSVDDLTELLGAAYEVDLEVEILVGISSVNIAEVLRDGLVENEKTHCTVYDLGLHYAVLFLVNSNLDRSMEADNTVTVSHHSFIKVTEYLTFTGLALAVESEVE